MFKIIGLLIIVGMAGSIAKAERMNGSVLPGGLESKIRYYKSASRDNSRKIKIEDFKNYADRPDFGEMEVDEPMSQLQLEDLFSGIRSNADLANEFKQNWTQEGLEQLYARIGSGPIPYGQFNGITILNYGGSLTKIKEMMQKVMSQTGFAWVAKLFPMTAGQGVEKFAETLWKGKEFFKLNDSRYQARLLNRMPTDKETQAAVEANLSYKGEKIIRKKGISGDKEEAMLFPAKVYCGESLLDARKESVIIDYAYSENISNDTVGHMEPGIDNWHRNLVSRKGLAVRDEIRMVRPGIYLGRAYMHRGFVLTFVLHREGDSENDIVGANGKYSDFFCKNPLEAREEYKKKQIL